MSAETIGKIVAVAIPLILSLITTLIEGIKAHKHKKAAKTEKEKFEAYQQMLEAANGFIVDAESFYKNLDTILKQQNMGSAGVYKKESVMNKLQSFAEGLKVNFDKDFWSKKIDELVKVTKSVNSK